MANRAVLCSLASNRELCVLINEGSVLGIMMEPNQYRYNPSPG